MADLEEVSRYYSDKISRFGPSASGVDWNGAEGQSERFARFGPLFALAKSPLSVIDYGCGYGELYRFLRPQFDVERYVGIDVAPAMLEAGREFLGENPAVVWADSLSSVTPAEVVVASGTYNVKLSVDSEEWTHYVLGDLKLLWQKANFGMSVNFLSDLSEVERREPRLFYAIPQGILAFCLNEISPLVFLDHAHSPWEFTVTIFREAR